MHSVIGSEVHSRKGWQCLVNFNTFLTKQQQFEHTINIMHSFKPAAPQKNGSNMEERLCRALSLTNQTNLQISKCFNTLAKG